MEIRRELWNDEYVMCIGRNKFYEKYIIDYKFFEGNDKGNLFYCLELRYKNGRKYLFKLIQSSWRNGSSDSLTAQEENIYNCLEDNNDFEFEVI